MGSRTYHGELTPGLKAPEPTDDPWLDDKTTAPYARKPARSARASRKDGGGTRAVSRDTRAWHTTGEWRETNQNIAERAEAEIAVFWEEQAEAERAKITQRKLEPRWMRASAVVVGSLMCGAFARVLLTPDASFSRTLPVQPSAAAAATLRIDSQPWSHVFVDDVPLGKTPQSAVPLQPGQHSVRLYNPERNLLKIVTLSAQPGESIERVEQLEK